MDLHSMSANFRLQVTLHSVLWNQEGELKRVLPASGERDGASVILMEW